LARTSLTLLFLESGLFYYEKKAKYSRELFNSKKFKLSSQVTQALVSGLITGQKPELGQIIPLFHGINMATGHES